ncbi:MAG: hypothetical protein RIS43_714 [Actinomycetota bacterium]|jgi:predicted phosphodiesterase
MKRVMTAVASMSMLVIITVTPSRASESAVIVAVGDIAQKNGYQAQTAALAQRIDPSQILLLGDLAYYQGSAMQFATYFAPTWGALANRTWAVPGNHEYGTTNANGYRAYARSNNWPMQSDGALWWDRNINNSNWAVIGLNSEVLAGKAGARQIAFLKAALTRHNGQPTIVMWHRPRFSQGLHGDNQNTSPLWQVIKKDPDVKIVLWGHDHNFQDRRFVVSPVGAPKRYLDTFVVGTGGAELRLCKVPSRPPSLLCGADNFGVLKLTLNTNSYTWQFVHVDDAVAASGNRSFS